MSGAPATRRRTARLVRFARIALKPGEKRRVTFELDGKALSTVDANGNRIVDAGPADVWIGGGQPQGPAATGKVSGVALHLNVKGRRSVPAF